MGHFLRQDLAKKNFFSNFFFLKMGWEGSILEASELSFFNFYQIFRVRAGQSWSTRSFSKINFDHFLTFFEKFFIIFEEP